MGNIMNKKIINGQVCKINKGDHILEGMFENNELNGYGTILMFRRGSIRYHYARKVGMFKDGLLHGQGLYVQPNGIKIEGEFQFGYLNGIGKIKTNGSVITGLFKNTKRNGLCKTVCQCGFIIEGIYKMNKLIEGTVTYPDGSIAIGKFLETDMPKTDMHKPNMHKPNMHKNPILNGKGKLIKTNGEVCEGNFKNGVMEGLCTIHRDGKLVSRGEFKNDKNVLGLRYYRDTNGVVLTFDHNGNPVEDKAVQTRNIQLISRLAEMIDDVNE
jgi:hypothetical protein